VVQAKALPTSFRTARARHDTDVTDYGVLPSLDREGRAGPYFGGFMVKAFAISGFEKDDVTALAKAVGSVSGFHLVRLLRPTVGLSS
jgi:hypothetical protein